MKALEEGLCGLDSNLWDTRPGEISGQQGCRNKSEKGLQARLSKLRH